MKSETDCSPFFHGAFGPFDGPTSSLELTAWHQIQQIVSGKVLPRLCCVPAKRRPAKGFFLFLPIFFSENDPEIFFPLGTIPRKNTLSSCRNDGREAPPRWYRSVQEMTILVLPTLTARTSTLMGTACSSGLSRAGLRCALALYPSIHIVMLDAGLSPQRTTLETARDIVPWLRRSTSCSDESTAPSQLLCHNSLQLFSFVVAPFPPPPPKIRVLKT